MKINSREKYLLGILISVLIMVAYYELVFINQSEKVASLKSQEKEIKSKYDSIMTTVKAFEDKKEELKILNSKIYDKSLVLYPSILQEKLVLELDDLLRRSNLKGNLVFSNIAVKPIDEVKSETEKLADSSLQPYVDQYNGKSATTSTSTSDNKTNTSSKNNMNIEQMKVTVNYNGGYNDLVAFVKNVEKHSKKIVITSVTMNLGANNVLTGVITMDFYSVPKLDNSNDNYFKWTVSGEFGKTNPFDGGTVASVSTATVSEGYDFLLIVRPSKSDLSTISLRYSKDTKMESNLYADNDNVEDVEISLVKENGKYYYKYKTSKESYPKNYSSNKIEFTPVGNDIVIDALSTIRIDEYDKSGVKLKVINNTDKNVNVVTSNDDSSRPRVSVTSEGKTVNVTKK